MSPQHLADQAVAAFADGVLTGHARERAVRHTAGCPECAHAVAVQREAVWALRAAPAPALPSGLLDRLRAVPVTTPVTGTPIAIGPDGAPMLATYSPAPSPAAPYSAMLSSPLAAAAFAPAPRARSSRARPMLTTAAVAAVAGVLAAGSVAHGAAVPPPRRVSPAVLQVGFTQRDGGVPASGPNSLWRTGH